MTICIFDGKHLVTDRLRTTNGCSKQRNSSVKKKIATFDDLYWEPGNKLLATATAGNVKAIDRFYSAISNSDPENVSKTLKLILDHQLGDSDMSALIVCQKSAMVYSSNMLKYYKPITIAKDALVIGSGKGIVRVLYGDKDLNLSALELAYMSSLFCDTVGNGLDEYSFETGECRYVKDLTKVHKRKLAKLLADKIINGSLIK